MTTLSSNNDALRWCLWVDIILMRASSSNF